MDDRRDFGTECENPIPEVSEKPVRRRFTAEYKLRILAEADACTERGSIAAVLATAAFKDAAFGAYQVSGLCSDGELLDK